MTSTAIVGPLPTVTIGNGRTSRTVVYTPPRDTLDDRYRTCTDHHLACDCREATFAEDRAEFAGYVRQVRKALHLLDGHATKAYDADGNRQPAHDCQCTGCKMARIIDSDYGWRYGREPEPDVAAALARADAETAFWTHLPDRLLPGVCGECRKPVPCPDRTAAAGLLGRAP